MTTAALTFGSAFLAFSPTACLIAFFIFQKPQLVIVATTSAFAYLISALFSSLFWLPVPSSIAQGSGLGTLFALVVPGVICQALVRCAFVKVYHHVEGAIRKSVANHERETEAAERRRREREQASSSGTNGADRVGASASGESSAGGDAHAETNALNLQLNDAACGISAGAGYGFMHALFLYGTLLASESGESNAGGTLYQPSCSVMPSLVNGAIIACFFSVLDVVWMMLAFFGMRRRQLYLSELGGGRLASGGALASFLPLPGSFLHGFSEDAKGGNAALGTMVLSHLLASLVLAPNGSSAQNGCLISLPLLVGVSVLSVVLFVRGVRGHFLPEDQRRRIHGMGGDAFHSQ